MTIKFSKTVKDKQQVIQTVVGKVDPTTVEEKVKKAREFLESRGIKDTKPLYSASA